MFTVKKECKNCARLTGLNKDFVCTGSVNYGYNINFLKEKCPNGCSEFVLDNFNVELLHNKNDLSAYYPYARLMKRYVK